MHPWTCREVAESFHPDADFPILWPLSRLLVQHGLIFRTGSIALGVKVACFGGFDRVTMSNVPDTDRLNPNSTVWYNITLKPL